MCSSDLTGWNQNSWDVSVPTAIQAQLAAYVPITLASGSQTWPLTANTQTYVVTGNTGGSTVTNWTGAQNGQRITLIFVDSNVTFTRANAVLDGSANFNSAQFKVLEIVLIGGVWYQIGKVPANG